MTARCILCVLSSLAAFAAADSINGTWRIQPNAGIQESQQECRLERKGTELRGRCQGERGDRCQFLRWTGMFVEAGWSPAVAHSNDRAYWRHSSSLRIGPDGKFVDEYECTETRPCYAGL